jgi:hypothetical protein
MGSDKKLNFSYFIILSQEYLPMETENILARMFQTLIIIIIFAAPKESGAA